MSLRRTKEIEMLESVEDNNGNNVMHDQNAVAGNGANCHDDDDARSQGSDNSGDSNSTTIPSKWLDLDHRLPTDSEFHQYMSKSQRRRRERQRQNNNNNSNEFADNIAIFVQEWTSHAIINAANNGLFDSCMKNDYAAVDDEIRCEYHMFEDVHDKQIEGLYELSSSVVR